MTDKQLLVKYEAERVALARTIEIHEVRMHALVNLVTSLRVMTGEAPPKAVRRGALKATGTKALILDVLADGKRRGAGEIASAIKVKTAATGWHLKELVASGDVERQGKSRATTYGIA